MYDILVPGLGHQGPQAPRRLPTATRLVILALGMLPLTSADAQELALPGVCKVAFGRNPARAKNPVVWPMAVIDNRKGEDNWEQLPVNSPVSVGLTTQFSYRPAFVTDSTAKSVLCLRHEPKIQAALQVGGRPVAWHRCEARVVELTTGEVVRQGKFEVGLWFGPFVPTEAISVIAISGVDVAVPNRNWLGRGAVEWLCNDKSLPCGGRRF